jgi:hypothetical protein
MKKELMEGQLLYRICGVFLILVVVYCAMVNIFGVHISSPNKCLFKEVAHLYCPGCGGTRAVHSMLSGHIIRSLEENAIVVPAFAFILYYFIGVTLAVRSKGTKIYFHLRKWMIVVFVLIVFWISVGRNLAVVYFGYDPIGEIIEYWNNKS